METRGEKEWQAKRVLIWRAKERVREAKAGLDEARSKRLRLTRNGGGAVNYPSDCYYASAGLGRCATARAPASPAARQRTKRSHYSLRLISNTRQPRGLYANALAACPGRVNLLATVSRFDCLVYYPSRQLSLVRVEASNGAEHCRSPSPLFTTLSSNK